MQQITETDIKKEYLSQHQPFTCRRISTADTIPSKKDRLIPARNIHFLEHDFF